MTPARFPRARACGLIEAKIKTGGDATAENVSARACVRPHSDNRRRCSHVGAVSVSARACVRPHSREIVRIDTMFMFPFPRARACGLMYGVGGVVAGAGVVSVSARACVRPHVQNFSASRPFAFRFRFRARVRAAS